MFGFNKNNSNREEAKREDQNENRIYIPAAIAHQYGTNDPQKINQIWHKYMPEITNAILNTEKHAVINNQNSIAIGDTIVKNHEELMDKINTLTKQNQELQERYNALVERMAGYIERENGKGR